MSAGKISDLPPEERYSLDRLIPMIQQAGIDFPLIIGELVAGLKYHAETKTNPEMIRVSLFKTKNQSQLKKRIEAIKDLCKFWMDKQSQADYVSAVQSTHFDLEKIMKDFNDIWTMGRNIELLDLPLIYDPASQDWEHVDIMERKVAPMVGDTIVLDCGDTVEVLHVNHQWNGDDADMVYVMTREVPQ